MGRQHSDAAQNSDYYEHVFVSVVNDDESRKLALQIAEETAADENITVTLADLSAGKRYLHQCILNMSLRELQGSAYDDLAALWARGSVGAARYRREQSGRGMRSR